KVCEPFSKPHSAFKSRENTIVLFGLAAFLLVALANLLLREAGQRLLDVYITAGPGLIFAFRAGNSATHGVRFV
ncbi:hypothetical protein BC940DRAFT_303643, partial [Gongronella butleri]